jgi:hypothetical protein
MNQILVEDHTIVPTEALQAIQASQTTERKRVLAKVYALLIKLADETENQPATPEVASAKEDHLAESNLVQLTLL